MAYFRCGQGAGGNELKILITTTDTSLYGQTITISKDGSTVGTTTFDNTGNAEYTVDEAGLYTVSCGGASESVLVEDEYEVSLSAIPDGSTVTPVNDIQTWLNCAGIFNKTTYTTLSEVLADTTTLLALINSNNAVDYMVRSHDWCADVCADATAMTYIGANNYAADTLLADSNEGLVPTMTSATTPSGTVTASGAYTDYDAWRAFNGFGQQYGWINSGSSPYLVKDGWVAYEFTTPKFISLAKVMARDSGYTVSGKIQSYANNDWQDISSVFTLTASSDTPTAISLVSGTYSKCRFIITTSASGSMNQLFGIKLQFYAKDGSWLESICNSAYFESVLDVKVPTMTDATIPSGEVLASDYASAAYEGYKAFDGKPATIWNSGTTGTTEYGKWIGYHFTSSVCIRKIMIRADSSYYPDLPKTFKGQTSNDGSTWNDVDGAVFTTINDSTASEQFFAFKNVTNVPYFRIALGNKWRNANYNDYVIAELQFYGRAAS